ncbi:hypothetical protein [Bacillus safensis]|uniref:hypothetical protein n=1 Tax=Bacillus safensis TaxID=561879 RepID=UPI003BF55769
MKKSYKILSIASILGLTAALSGCQLLDQKSGTSESNKTNEQKTQQVHLPSTTQTIRQIHRIKS